MRSDAIRMDRMPANTAGWPRAAAEHARLIALRINTLDPQKYPDNVISRRLYKTLSRLQKRHMPTPKLPRELRRRQHA